MNTLILVLTGRLPASHLPDLRVCAVCENGLRVAVQFYDFVEEGKVSEIRLCESLRTLSRCVRQQSSMQPRRGAGEHQRKAGQGLCSPDGEARL